MVLNMKQIRLFLYAAISVLAVASCAKTELVEPEALASGESTVLTLSLGSAETKTALVGGKTTWVEGDVVRIYNATGTFYQDVKVPASAAGQKTTQLEVNMADSVYYAVYPVFYLFHKCLLRKYACHIVLSYYYNSIIFNADD